MTAKDLSLPRLPGCPSFDPGDRVFLRKGGAAWTVIESGEFVALRSEGGRIRRMTPNELWSHTDHAAWWEARARAAERQRVAERADLSAAILEWRRPVMKHTRFEEPSSVGVSIYRDRQQDRWLYISVSSPEIDGAAALTRESALRLATELERIATLL